MAEGARHGPHVQPIDMGAHQITHVADATETDGAAALGQVPVVAADAADTTPANWGSLDEKEVVDASMRKSVIATGPTRQVQLGVAISDQPGLPPQSEGGSGPTTAGTKASGEGHWHPFGPQPDPTTDGARLHTAAIAATVPTNAKAIIAPVRRWADVDAMGFYYYGGFSNPASHWAQISPGVWERPSMYGPILGGEFGLVEAFLGLRFLYATWSSAVITDPNADFGIYVITQLGGGGENAQITRSADADASADFQQGKIVNVIGGSAWGGHTFDYSGDTLPTLETTALTFIDRGTSSVYKDVPDGEMGFGSVWTAVIGSVCAWEKQGDTVGANVIPPSPTNWLASTGLPGDVISGSDYFFINEETPFGGLYEIVTYGLYQQVIRRIATANTAAAITATANFVVYINGGSGVFGNGTYRRQTATVGTIDVDATAWSESASPPVAATDKLLTGAQLTSEHASMEPVFVRLTLASHGAGMLWFNALMTVDGTPGVSRIPAGRETLQVANVYVEGWDPGVNPGTVTMSYVLYNQRTGATIFTAVCPIGLPTVPTRITWQYDLATDFTDILPTDKLTFDVYIESTVDAEITVNFLYNDAEHATWVQLAGVTFPIGGTDDHRALAHRNDDDSNTGRGQHDSGTVMVDDNETTFTGNLAGVTRLDAAMTVLDQLATSSSTITWTGRIWVPQSAMCLDGAALKNRTVLGTIGQRTETIALPHGSTNGAAGSFVVPGECKYATSLTIRPVWAPGATSSGAVRWSVSLQIEGTDITWTPTPIAFTGDSEDREANTVVKESGVSSGDVQPAPGGWCRIGIYRVGGAAEDTYSGTAYLLGVQLDYTAEVALS